MPGSVCCSYRKISGDTCTGGDVESRLEGELVPCPLAGECEQDLLCPQGLHSLNLWLLPQGPGTASQRALRQNLGHGSLAGLQIALSCPGARAAQGPAREQCLPTVQSPLKSPQGQAASRNPFILVTSSLWLA